MEDEEGGPGRKEGQGSGGVPAPGRPAQLSLQQTAILKCDLPGTGGQEASAGGVGWGRSGGGGGFFLKGRGFISRKPNSYPTHNSQLKLPGTVISAFKRIFLSWKPTWATQQGGKTKIKETQLKKKRVNRFLK